MSLKAYWHPHCVHVRVRVHVCVCVCVCVLWWCTINTVSTEEVNKVLLSHDLTWFQSSGIQPAGAGDGGGSAQFPLIKEPGTGRGDLVFLLTGLHAEFWKLVFSLVAPVPGLHALWLIHYFKVTNTRRNTGRLKSSLVQLCVVAVYVMPGGIRAER